MGWTLLRPRGGALGHTATSLRRCQGSSEERASCWLRTSGLRPSQPTCLWDGTAMSPYLLQKTLGILTGHLQKSAYRNRPFY